MAIASSDGDGPAPGRLVRGLFRRALGIGREDSGRVVLDHRPPHFTERVLEAAGSQEHADVPDRADVTRHRGVGGTVDRRELVALHDHLGQHDGARRIARSTIGQRTMPDGTGSMSAG